MDSFTHNNLNQLVACNEGTKISLYMPTVRAGRDVRQNSIRFTNLIKRARNKRTEQQQGERQIDERIEEAATLATNDDWWQHQSDGFTMFLADDRTECYRLPGVFSELVTVGPRFHITPLVRMLQGDGQFHLLAVSQNRVRLFQCTHHGINELQPNNLPTNLRSALNIDEYTSTLQQHSTGGPRAAGGTMFHGQGAADLDVQKQDEITQYFRVINRALSSFFNDEHLPLVFAGVDYLFPIFRSTCNYSGVVEQPVVGNPDNLSADDLHTKAWRIVEPMFLRHRESALAQFNKFVANEKTTTELGKILRAAHVGAIDTLLLAEDGQLWGSTDNPAEAVAGEGNCGDEELLNYSAVQTLAGGGTVYTLPKRRMPHEQYLAAMLRFQVD